jgi:lipopolysaccharide transport protein LptA
VKISGYIALTSLAGAGMLLAQTNITTSTTSTNANTNAVNEILALVTTNAPAPKPQPRGPTRIESDSVDFDLTAREATYRGHVRVDDPEMKLSCEWLVADLPQTGGRINHIVAETNVVIDATDDKGQKMHATGEKAVYVYSVPNGVTNETVTLTGHPELSNAQGTSTGDVIVWDRVNNHLNITNPRIVFRQNLNGAMGGTNSMVVEANSAVTETNSPPTATNQMTAPK